MLFNALSSIKYLTFFIKPILINYIKDNFSLIYANIFAFKPLYSKKLYLLSTVFINIIGSNYNNSIVIG